MDRVSGSRFIGQYTMAKKMMQKFTYSKWCQSKLRLIIRVVHIVATWKFEGGFFSPIGKWCIWKFYYLARNMMQKFTFVSTFEVYRPETMSCTNKFNENIHTPGYYIWCLIAHYKVFNLKINYLDNFMMS